MIESTTKATLKTGESVDFSIVKAPDAKWAPVIMNLIGHKGEIWNWQNEQMLKESVGIDFYYYFLHRQGTGFSNVATGEYRGVGSFGHVYTTPDDRRKGACAVIMERQMAHFRERGGRYLTLGTGFETPPYNIYKKFGFVGVESHNGHMTYCNGPVNAFMDEYFAPCKAVIEPISWKHWPGTTVLFLSDAPGVIRMAPERVFGRVSTEGPLLHVIRDRVKPNGLTRGHALVNPDTGAVLGIAVWNWDKLWTGTLVIDVFCHPRFWNRAPDLLKALELAPDERHLAYADALCPQKRDALESVGFKVVTTLPKWQRISWAGPERIDVTLLERRV
ncbi:MAG: GNAT family N-acetyltransferase [Lentisphaerae bacterium]|nr:GNAT family N-acetyltransferase [Lentisphaerota bacterium]